MVFTSGGTEADNLAVKGIFWAAARRGPAPHPHPGHRGRAPRRARPAATGCADAEGAEVELLPVDDAGRLDVEALRAAVERDPESVALISVMWANNEVGTLQPIDEVVAVAARARHPGAHRRRPGRRRGAGRLRGVSGVDALTLTGHKVGGPYGVGALARAPRARRSPRCVHGGGQERDIRSGTIDTPGDRRLRRRGRARGQGSSPSTPRGSARCATTWSAGCIEVVPDAHLHGAAGPPARTGCPATPTSASPAARATRC